MIEKRLKSFRVTERVPFSSRENVKGLYSRMPCGASVWKLFGYREEGITCGGEFRPEARVYDFAWILDSMEQCVEYDVPF